MHRESFEEMRRNLDQWCGALRASACTVVDVGSRDINGTYRPLIGLPWNYLGVDVEAGRNVDRVMPSEFDTGLANWSADIVLCGQVLEHCRDPVRLVRELSRVLRRDGYVFCVAPAEWPVHRYPLDCWRVRSDGMREALEQAGLECVSAYERPVRPGMVDCWGIGRKSGGGR